MTDACLVTEADWDWSAALPDICPDAQQAIFPSEQVDPLPSRKQGSLATDQEQETPSSEEDAADFLLQGLIDPKATSPAVNDFCQLFA